MLAAYPYCAVLRRAAPCCAVLRRAAPFSASETTVFDD